MRFLQSIGCMTPAAILIYGVVGLLLVTQFGGQILNYLNSMGWVQVSGEVITSEVVDAWDTTGERYVGQVTYTYDVDGTIYEGDQIDLRGVTYVRDRADAEQLLTFYPVGADVMVYVDPANPNQAVLDRTLPRAIWGIVGVGSLLFLMSLGLSVRHFTARQLKQIELQRSAGDHT